MMGSVNIRLHAALIACLIACAVASDVQPKLLRGEALWTALEKGVEVEAGMRASEGEHRFQVGDENPLGWVPQYKATVKPNHPVGFAGECFADIDVRLQFTQDGVDVVFNVSDATKTICDTVYLVTTDSSFHLKRLVFKGEHTVHIRRWKSPAEKEYVESTGVQIFMFKEHALDFVLSAYELIHMFTSDKNQEQLMEFLEEKMKMPFVPRKDDVVFPESQLENGLYLAIMKLNGSHGGDNTIEGWATGGYTGHVAAVMQMDNTGEYYVVESKNPHIMMTKWSEWVQIAQETGWLVGVLKLTKENQAKFQANLTKIQTWVRSVLGNSYGYANYLFGWIDGVHNFPGDVTVETMATAFQLIDVIKPATSDLMWGQALNHRLGTKGLNVPQLFVEMAKRNLTFADVIAMPENDEWTYSIGPSRVCSSFVSTLYKLAGVLGPEIQATELTPRDTYSVQIFDANWQRPSACAQDDLPYCQVSGKYILHLPGYNSIPQYPHMFEKCATQPYPFTYAPAHC